MFMALLGVAIIAVCTWMVLQGLAIDEPDEIAAAATISLLWAGSCPRAGSYLTTR